VREAVIDTSSLLAISHLNLATELSLFFDVIHVPRQVQIELNKKHKFRYTLNKLYETGIYTRCVAADRTNVSLLMPPLNKESSLDEGEAEGIIQAQEKGIEEVIFDEKEARHIASLMGITPIGVARLLFRLERDGHIEDANKLIKKIQKELKFRISKKVVEEARQKSEEPI
jgi:predicted nucleic acid-binding protein